MFIKYKNSMYNLSMAKKIKLNKNKIHIEFTGSSDILEFKNEKDAKFLFDCTLDWISDLTGK